VVDGVITAIDEDGALLTIDRDEEDADPADDLSVAVTDETKVQPPGAEPEVGAVVRAMLIPPEEEGEPYEAHMLILREHRPQPPRRPENRQALRVCGEIAALPGDPEHVGTWTISTPHLGEHEIEVTAETEIEPTDVEPEVGMHACAWAERGEDGWVAEKVRLDCAREREEPGTPGPRPGPGPGPGPGRGQERRAVHFEGVVAGVDEAGEDQLWTITTDDGDLEIVVTEKTKLIGFGEDPVGEEVEGVAKPDDDGNLIARMIRVE
jgi:hypothetical protein